jgi:hypothetical protein
MEANATEAPLKPVAITPELALDLRLRYLESLVSPDSRSSSNPSSTSISLARRVSHIEAQLKQALESGGSTDAVRKFVQNCEFHLARVVIPNRDSADKLDSLPSSTELTDDSNSPLLSVAPVSTDPPDSNEMSISAKVSLVLEAEQEIRNLERDLRDLEMLNQRGVVEAGKLPGKLYL